MVDSRRRDAWEHTSQIANLLFNAHRNPDTSAPTTPNDWTPFPTEARPTEQTDVLKTDIRVLKALLPPSDPHYIGPR